MDTHSTATPEVDLTTTIQTASQSKIQNKGRTKYRARRRADGVITEYPRYFPASLPPKPAFKFEKHVVELNNSAPMSKSKTVPKLIRTMSQDLLGISISEASSGRDGYNEPVDCRRGGYNTLLSNIGQEDVDILIHQGGGRYITPMQRFLAEPGPWSVYQPADQL